MLRQSTTRWLSLVGTGIVRGAVIWGYACLSVMVVVVITNVFMRYVVGRALYWGDEIMIYLMLLIIYLGFGTVLAKGKHIRMTVVFNRLPPKAQNVLWIILGLIGTGYASFLLYAVILKSLDTLRLGTFSTITDLPIAPWQMVLAFGLLSLVIAFVMLVVQRIAIALATGAGRKVQERRVKPEEELFDRVSH